MPINNIDQTEISTIIVGKEIIFEFITDSQTRMLNEVRDILLNKEKQVCFLKEEIGILKINEQLKKSNIQTQIKLIEQQFNNEICNNLPNTFWDRKKHFVSLPYEDGFDEKQIPTKARPAQMNQKYLELCKNEIKS